MCTVTAHIDSGRLLVTMNRDEHRSRPPEQPPRVHAGPPAWMAPHDGASGGTWMGANNQGVVACILNLYEKPVDSAPPRGPVSRGGIIPDLLARGPVAEGIGWLREGFDAGPYDPFTLGVFSLKGGLCYTWRGEGALEETVLPAGWSLLTSSSWRPADVEAWRREAFGAWQACGCPYEGVVPAYHVWQPEGAAHWAPLMSRETAATRSITQVVVDAVEARCTLRYWPEPAKPLRLTDHTQTLPLTAF